MKEPHNTQELSLKVTQLKRTINLVVGSINKTLSLFMIQEARFGWMRKKLLN